MQFHILSFEGPDPYSRVGGLATRVEGLTQALAGQGYETHLWYLGDPDLPEYERQGNLHLHRWCQWVSRHHSGGVYDGEHAKAREYAASLPPHLLRNVMLPALLRGEQAAVIAEEWQTTNAVLHLDYLLQQIGQRRSVSILWTANNIFGFESVDWQRLKRAATITTVSRYMKHKMEAWDLDAVVIPNGLSPDAFASPERRFVNRLRQRIAGRLVITKMARWDPAKRWMHTVKLTAELKRQGYKPLLVARGGSEPYGREVLGAARSAGLRISHRKNARGDCEGFVGAVGDAVEADVINLESQVDPDSRRVLFRTADAVLANSSHEPFGLVGLEAMAVGGIACTGCSGEDYVVPGRNALVLQTEDPQEFIGLYGHLKDDPAEISAMRRAGRATARIFSWNEVVRRNLLPRLDLVRSRRLEIPKRPPAMRALPAPSA